MINNFPVNPLRELSPTTPLIANHRIILISLYKILMFKGGVYMPNLNDNKFKKIQSESQKQGKSQEEYAAELEMNKLKSQKRT
jgi:hypothetical protein